MERNYVEIPIKHSKNLVILENLQNYPRVAHIVILTSKVYQNVINEDNHKQIKTFSKNSIHKVHESRRDIG